jgi:hypothetical protein
MRSIVEEFAKTISDTVDGAFKGLASLARVLKGDEKRKFELEYKATCKKMELEYEKAYHKTTLDSEREVLLQWIKYGIAKLDTKKDIFLKQMDTAVQLAKIGSEEKATIIEHFSKSYVKLATSGVKKEILEHFSGSMIALASRPSQPTIPQVQYYPDYPRMPSRPAPLRPTVTITEVSDRPAMPSRLPPLPPRPAITLTTVTPLSQNQYGMSRSFPRAPASSDSLTSGYRYTS